MMTELRPCPFCGAEAEIGHEHRWISGANGGYSGAYIVCKKCRCRTCTYDWEDEDQMYEAWNRRMNDVAKVVHCKECDLWNECNEAGHEQTGNYVCSCEYFSNEDGYVVYTRPDDYCSYGERKEGK